MIAFYGALPETVQAFRSRHPDIAIDLVERNSPALEAALAQGELDLGILHPPLATPGLELALLPSEPLLLAMPASHRLARKRSVAIAELTGEPLLVAPRSIGPHLFDRIVALFQNEGVTPRFVQEVAPMTTLVGLVAAGAGLGFVTQGIAASARPGVACRPVTPVAPSLPMAAAWRAGDLPATAERFLAMALAATGQASGSGPLP